MTAPLTPADVQRTGRALYGDNWQSALATALGVNLRTMQRVARAAAEGEDYPAVRSWADDLRKLASNRSWELQAMMFRRNAATHPFAVHYASDRGGSSSAAFQTRDEAQSFAATLWGPREANNGHLTTWVMIKEWEPA